MRVIFFRFNFSLLNLLLVVTIVFDSSLHSRVFAQLSPPQKKTYAKKKKTGKKKFKKSKYYSKNSSKKNKDVFDFIIVDAGHGGRDSGAVGQFGIYEKHIVLKVAKKIAKLLKKGYPKKHIYLTRNKDVFVTLDGRTRIANKKFKLSPNGLFISIHCNFARNSRIKGFEIYYLSEKNRTRGARRLATFENKHLIAPTPIKELKQMESYMILSQIRKESLRFAYSINSAMRKKLKPFTFSRGVKSANFHVLRGSLMPAVLIEIGFISNRREAKRLRSAKYLTNISYSVFNGVKRFLNTRIVTPE